MRSRAIAGSERFEPRADIDDTLRHLALRVIHEGLIDLEDGDTMEWFLEESDVPRSLTWWADIAEVSPAALYREAGRRILKAA